MCGPNPVTPGRLEMKRKIVLLVCVIALLAASSRFAQQSAPKSESSKYRTIFTLGGAGGGFALGLGGGLAAFDDDVNSNRKVWTTAILAGIGGGAGGYFIGRALDKHKAKTSWRYIPDQLDRSLIPYQLPGTPTDGDSVSMPTCAIRGRLDASWRILAAMFPVRQWPRNGFRFSRTDASRISCGTNGTMGRIGLFLNSRQRSVHRRFLSPEIQPIPQSNFHERFSIAKPLGNHFEVS
jgi:hypothetical protein